MWDGKGKYPGPIRRTALPSRQCLSIKQHRQSLNSPNFERYCSHSENWHSYLERQSQVSAQTSHKIRRRRLAA